MKKTIFYNKIIGTGSKLPAKRVSNKEMEAIVETSDAWIVERTGIEARHVCTEGETTATLAAEAARHAIGNAGLLSSDIDLIVVATSTPDYSFPAVAAQVQATLKIPVCTAFDVQAVCSGFLYALQVAHALLEGGAAKTALVIGADTFSKMLDYTDRSTCVLFGDGAGAVVLQRQSQTIEEGKEKKNGQEVLPQGVIGIETFADGRHVHLLKSTGGVSTTGQAGVLTMQGKEVFRHAVRTMADLVPFMLEKYGYEKEELDWLVPHQANKRIIEAVAKASDFPMGRMVLTVQEHANTSAASIPMALDEAVRTGKIRQGNLVMLEAFGAGFTWGAALVRW